MLAMKSVLEGATKIMLAMKSVLEGAFLCQRKSFMYPQIDENKCSIHCYQCVRTCPIKKKKSQEGIYYAQRT